MEHIDTSTTHIYIINIFTVTTEKFNAFLLDKF